MAGCASISLVPRTHVHTKGSSQQYAHNRDMMMEQNNSKVKNISNEREAALGAHWKATQFEGMSAVKLLILLAGIGTSMAAVDDCQRMEYWNGTQCAPCTGCPRGFGVKTPCTSKQDTECQACISGYDYSNTSGFDECILCDKYSNCLPGFPKVIQNCTIFSPPVCDGCKDGYYFKHSAGMSGGCVECTPPCNILEEETTKCTTDHDRRCIAKATEPTSTISTLGTPSKGSAIEEIPSSTDDGGKVLPEDPALAARGTELAPTLVKNTWLWVGVGVASAVLAIALVVAIKRKKSNRKKRGDVNKRSPATRVQDTQQGTPLLPSTPGLDLPIKNLTTDERRFITQRLNEKYYDGYFYWQLTAEKLGLHDECATWKIAENPTEKFLKAYGEKEGSTVRSLTKALREPEVDLTQIAKEIDEKFAPSPEDQGEPPERIVDTYV